MVSSTGWWRQTRWSRWSSLPFRCHPTLRLCITAFDSGPITPGPADTAAGWIVSGKVMVSPPLTDGLHIPADGYDEWYLLDHVPPPDWNPEVFVNYGGFTLQSAAEICNGYDSTWDRHGLEWLNPMQARFWRQIQAINPVSYIALGDRDVVVSRQRGFLEQLRALVRG